LKTLKAKFIMDRRLKSVEEERKQSVIIFFSG